MAKRIARRASAAPCSFRTSAGPRIRAVGLDLTVARQAAFFPLAGAVSATLNLCILNLLDGLSQWYAKESPTPFDLFKGVIAAALSDCG